MNDSDIHLNARLTAETLDTYFRGGLVVTLGILSSPRCMLRIDPVEDVLELWTGAVGVEPDVSSLSKLSVSTEELDDGAWFVLSVDAKGARVEAYSLIAAIVDDLADNRPFQVAVSRSLNTFRDLLSSRGRLGEERALGLVGELLVLEHLIGVLGESDAVPTWLGADSEEHDFVLPSLDAEVKTTLSERRSHIISSETQLQDSPARPLWVVSIQLTRAGTAAEGFSLADVVGRVRGLLSSSSDSFNAHLGSQGWRDGDIDLYNERYMPRTRPRAYLVDDRFPAITRERLDVVVPQPELVGAVTYRVDLTAMAPRNPGGPLSTFVEGNDA